MSDREDFRAARDAGLKARHETRLARAQAEIPDEAVDAAIQVITATGSEFHTERVNRANRDRFRAGLEAALPHLRPHETREARAIRREVAEEIAEALEAFLPYYSTDMFPADGTTSDAIAAKAMRHAYPTAARIAREIGSKEAGE